MTTHIYAFGSVCRGDVTLGSDIDLLAILDEYSNQFSPSVYSIYSYRRLIDLWAQGNPFAWHLSLESRLLFASDKQDFIKDLGRPQTYTKCLSDCRKFFNLFLEAESSIKKGRLSIIFDLSTIFLSIRNFATCFSLGMTSEPDFSRNSALNLGLDRIPLEASAYGVFERARILSTRGYGGEISEGNCALALGQVPKVELWMRRLVERIENGS